MAADVILDVQELRAYYRILKGDVKAVDGVTFRRGEGKSWGSRGNLAAARALWLTRLCCVSLP